MCTSKNYLLVKLPVDSQQRQKVKLNNINKPICMPTEVVAINFSVTSKQVSFLIK